MSSDRLVYMANQIATFFASQPETTRVQGVADHLNDFWDPSMRRALVDMAPERDGDLHPLVRAALPLVRTPA